jgi:hypothetical protein
MTSTTGWARPRWLENDPERDSITRRYLKHQHSLVDRGLAQPADEGHPDPDAVAETQSQEEEAVERTISLNEQRLVTVLSLKQCHPMDASRSASLLQNPNNPTTGRTKNPPQRKRS